MRWACVCASLSQCFFSSRSICFTEPFSNIHHQMHYCFVFSPVEKLRSVINIGAWVFLCWAVKNHSKKVCGPLMMTVILPLLCVESSPFFALFCECEFCAVSQLALYKLVFVFKVTEATPRGNGDASRRCAVAASHRTTNVVDMRVLSYQSLFLFQATYFFSFAFSKEENLLTLRGLFERVRAPTQSQKAHFAKTKKQPEKWQQFLLISLLGSHEYLWLLIPFSRHVSPDLGAQKQSL